MQKAKSSSKKDSLLKDKLLEFFTKKRLLIVADVLDKKTKYSLRVVEYFVSKYSKKKDISYRVKNKDFNVFNSYKNGQMKSFQKKQFDVFRRSSRFTIEITPDRKIETTVAQLNFFRWAIENNVLLYVENNLEKIKKDMDASEKKLVKTSQNIVITRNSITIFFD